jgi:hypothetical protein
VASVTIEVAGDQAPYHVYCGSRYPIKGAIRFAIDMSFDSTKHHTAKLYEFISSRATRPIVESKDAQTKMFQEGKLHWVVERPSANHIYVVTWKEPCECSWCQAVNFG